MKKSVCHTWLLSASKRNTYAATATHWTKTRGTQPTETPQRRPSLCCAQSRETVRAKKGCELSDKITCMYYSSICALCVTSSLLFGSTYKNSVCIKVMSSFIINLLQNSLFGWVSIERWATDVKPQWRPITTHRPHKQTTFWRFLSFHMASTTNSFTGSKSAEAWS